MTQNPNEGAPIQEDGSKTPNCVPNPYPPAPASRSYDPPFEEIRRSSGEGGLSHDEDEITKLLGVGLPPEKFKAYKKARSEYVDGSDANPSYGEPTTGIK